MSLLTHYFLALMTVAVSVFGLGLFVLGKNSSHQLNRQLCVFHISVACWSFGEAMMIVSGTQSEGMFWNRVEHLGVAFIPSTFLHFALTLLEAPQQKKHAIPIAYTYSLVWSLLLFNQKFLPDPLPKFQFKYCTEPGPLYYPFVVLWMTIIVYVLVEGSRAYLRAVGERKNRLKYFFLGAMIGFVGGSPNFFFPFNYQIYPINPFGTYGVVLYAIVLTYAVVKHHLMDINIVVRKGLVYSVLVACITITYLVVVLVTERIFQQVMGYRSFVGTVAAATLIAIFFIPLKNHIQRILDKLFFHGTQEVIAAENERLREELRRSEQLKAASLFAAGVAHEIKNPLTAIQTFIEHLPEQGADPSFREKFYRIVGGEVAKIKGLVGNLMSFARPAPLQARAISVAELLDETLDVLTSDCLKRGIRVERRYAHNGARLTADPAQLRQAVMNVVLNSIEAMERGGTLTMETASTPEVFTIRIVDTGGGIAPQDLPRVTEPFYSTKTQGTGLGLSIVQGIVASHGGRLHINSQPHRGTTVTMELLTTGVTP